MAEVSDSEFWLFGYGSLIWKPPPHFDRRIPGYVIGYVRRFWQPMRRLLLHLYRRSPCFVTSPQQDYLYTPTSILLEDHRGTPEAPGRVVTLIERSFWESLHDQYTIPEDKVWGAAYRIEASNVKEVQEYLDIREINGYSIQYAQFNPAESAYQPFKCMVYIGMPDNPQFMGVQEPEALAKHIIGSVGPSGLNKDYLYMLEQALDELSPASGDAHITDLAKRMRRIEDSRNATGQQSVHGAVRTEGDKANEQVGVVEQAETEKHG